jgi:hypothetical protein
MLEKFAATGRDRRRNERLPAFTQPHMPSVRLSRCGAADPVPPSALAPGLANREFFARFLLDTHYPFKGHSSRHSDTSRIQDNSRLLNHLIFSTRHLNATLVSRHSNAKFPPFLPSLFFSSALPDLPPLLFPALHRHLLLTAPVSGVWLSVIGRARLFDGHKTAVLAEPQNPQERRLFANFRIYVMYKLPCHVVMQVD